MKTKVYVGISGGVDSAVSAYILKEQEYDVTGVFMKNWSGNDYGIADQCPWKRDLEDSKAICEHLDIPHKIYNFEKEYQSLVIDNFFSEYKSGKTPNPDVLCNKYIKFDLFLKKALYEGAEFIATGHYARNLNNYLYKGVDPTKDQSYFLYQITKEQLSKSLFPVGDKYKKEIREIAKNINLPVAKKKDSQGICFVGKINVNKFIKSQLGIKPGKIIDVDKNIQVGNHEGVWFYTNGQRRGIKIGGNKQPYYICNTDIKSNTIFVAEGRNNKHLLKNQLVLNNINLFKKISNNSINLTAQIRYRGQYYQCLIKDLKNESITLDFPSPIWAPSIGQSTVIYDNDLCLGGGIISKINA